MARNLFGPMGAFSNSAPATTAPQTQSNQPKSSEPDVFGIARKYRIPPNIIIALQERGEDPEKAAQSIIAGLDAGKSFEDIVPKAVRIRASDIADEIEGITPEGGMGKALGVGIDVVQQGFGSALEGSGRSLGIDSLERYGARVAEDNAAEAASGARGLTGLGDVDGVGSAASYASETLAQQVPQLATSLGPVAAGAAIGSVVPGIGTALGAGVGLGVAGIGNIAQFYGMNRERQKEANPGEEVNELAAFGTAIPQAATDLASDVLIATPLGLGPKALQTGNMAMRALKGAGAGVAVEAPTEVLQQGMERAQAGLPIANADAGREYLESAVAGGLVGGTVGGVRGALSRPVEDEVQPPAADPLAQTPAAPLALPAPTNGGTLFLPNPGGDGSAAGQNAAPNMAPPGGIGAAFDEPEGPLTRAAKSAPDMTPQAAPAPLFPDMKPGAKIVLADPETGELVDATFQREENGVPIVRINGQEQPVPPEIFDIAVNEGMKAMESARGAKGSLAAAAKPKAPRPQAPEPELDDLPLEQAIARLNDVNERIRVMARPSKKVLETREKLTEIIARKQGEANAQGATDGTPPTDGMAGGQSLGEIAGGNTAGSRPDQVAPVQAAPVSSAPVGSGGEGLAGATGGAEPSQALTPPDQFDADMTDDMIAVRAAIRDGKPVTRDGEQVSIGGVTVNAQDYEDQVAKVAEEDGFRDTMRGAINEKLSGQTQPRAPVAPITTPPSERMQPDLLGGQAVSEEDMAAKERRRREWGRYLAIAEGGKSNDDMQLEGRDILIRPGFTVIRAKNGQRSDLDYRLDTTGMSRDDIAAAMRGALRELDRVSPLPAPEPARPVAAQIAEAAASAEPNPTEAQKEAGNYRKGHQNWRGLGLTFETAEGETRTGKGPDGKEWSVKMPAHYGYLKRTEGADGENLDFYMGPNTDSDSVFVVDQVDAETGRFDEHKIIFGADNQLQAAELYAAGFSDGKGPQRMGAITQLTMEQFKNALRNSDWNLPTSVARQDTGRGPIYASGFLDRFRGKLREAPSYLKNGKAKRTWEEGWTAANKHPMAPALPGSEAATGPSTLQIKNLRTGKTSEIEGQSSQPASPQKGGWKQIGTNARGKPLFEDERGVRSYTEGGVRVSESVGVVPGGGITIEKEKRGRDYLTQEEWDAKNPPQSAPTGPRILVNVVGPDGLTDAERKAGKEPYNKPRKAERIEEEAEKAVAYLTQQIEREKNKARDARSRGDSSKAAIHDVNLRRLRMNIFKAEAAIKEALQQGQFAPFAASEADFPLAAAQLRSAIGRIAPMEDDTAPASPATPDGSAFEAVGMVKGKSTAEDAWFRKQAEQGGIAIYKARAVASGWKLTRDFQPGNDVTAPPTRQLGTVATTADAIAQLRENGMRTGVPEEADTGPAQTPKQPAPPTNPIQAADSVLRANVPAPPLAAMVNNAAGQKAAKGWWQSLTDNQRFIARTFGMNGVEGKTAENWWNESDTGQQGEVLSRTMDAHGSASPERQNSFSTEKTDTSKSDVRPAQTGILSALSEEKQKRVAELQAMLAAKVRNQTSSGVDPEYLTLGGELVALYVEAGVKKFGQMLKDFAESTGLSMREAQAPMRVAYNHVRDTMDLDGEDVSDFDTADQVMAEIRAAIAAEAPKLAAQESPEARAEQVRAEAQTRDWWNNGIAPATRPILLKDMGLFEGQEESIGARKWDALSEGQRAQIVAATEEMRRKRAEEKEAEEVARAERQRIKDEANAAEKARKEEADLRASVSPLSSIKGGTANAVVKFGDASRLFDVGNHVGHGQFFMERGIDPAFDQAVVQAGPKPIASSESVARLLAAAGKGREPIEWRFVRNSRDGGKDVWRPTAVVGRWDNSSSAGKKMEWVAVNPLIHNYLERKGLVLTAGGDMGILAIRRKNGELVGAAAPISLNGLTNLAQQDAIANPDPEAPPAATDQSRAARSQAEAKPKVIDRDTDLRGVAFAVTNANGDLVTSGSNPALADLTDTNRAGYFMDMADQAGGALFVGPIAGVQADTEIADRIFGMTWEELQRRQQGAGVSRPVRSKMPEGAVEVYRAAPQAEAEAAQAQDAPTKPKRQTPKQAREQQIARLREYFRPGNIVRSYGGADRVISFNEKPDGDWDVTVQSVVQENGEWVNNPSDNRIRTHSTTPNDRELARGPIQAAPTAAEAFDAAAAEADPDPTPAQAEAGNYRKGHHAWNGLDLTIETERLQERRGFDADGNVAWSVKMPAHYGYIKRTTGADSEQVDFYMGPEPDSDVVVIVDQVDAETGAFDEHKTMLGFRNRKAALDTYVLGFSDGKGKDRLGAHKVMTVAEFKEWLETGDLTKPVRLGQAEATAKTGKIEDFGEKIGGARKDVWGGFKDRMDDAANLDVAAEPLSKSWPEPDYEKLIESGIEPWTVAFIRAAREEIPRKPSKGWKVKGWAENVVTLRGLAMRLMKGEISQERVIQSLSANLRLDQRLGTKIEAYMAVGHAKSLKDMTFGTATYSVLNGQRFNPSRTFWEVSKEAKATIFNNMPRVLVRADTKAELLRRFTELHAQLDEGGQKRGSKDKGTKFLIYRMRNAEAPEYRIGVKIGRNYIDLRSGIADVAEARRIVAEESEQLQTQLDEMRDIPNERRDENAPRIGVDHRNGADVTPEQFAEAFGFKGVEFGNWVEQSRRQQDLNESFDALMDLAAILDIPPRAISLNGTLGLAFGARGKGGKNPAAAHYEPGKVVINLTKRAGRGSLAHEWFHALDNYFARKRQPMRGNYITDNNAPGGQLTDGVRPETIEAFRAVKRAIMATELPDRSKRLDKLRTEPYFGTGIEMHARAFESYVIAKLEDQNASNDYLANTVSGVSWSMLADMKGLGDSYPYLKPEEIESVRPAFDELFRIMERRETDRGVALEMREDSAPVATLTGDELGRWEDIRQLGRKAEAWYRDNLVGQTVTNEATGMEIKFDTIGANKVGGRKGDILYRSVPALREMLRGGVLLSSERDNRGRPDIKAVHKFGATVSLAGENYALIATVREKADGSFHYDLSRNVDEAQQGREARAAVRVGDAQVRGSALEGGPVDLNLEFAPASRKGDAAIGGADLRAMAADLNAMPEIAAMGGRVPVRVVSDLVSLTTGNPILGRFNAGRSDIEVRAGGDAKGVMRHEVIHALRSERLWGKPFGLFTAPEWRELARMAKQQPEIVASVRKRYAEKPPEVQTEEMVAELYRLWAANRDGYGAVEKALLKVEGFLTALANALRGRGFVSAARTMEQIASGRIGGRGPDGPGGGRRGRDAEMRPEGRQPLLSGAVLGQVRADLQTAGRVDPAYPLARIPEVLARLGIENAPLVVRKSVFNKAMGKHQLSLDEAVRAIEGLANPVMVFDSETVSGAFVSLVDVGNDKSVVVAVHPDGEVGRMAVSYVASIHKKDNPSAVLRWVNDGLVRYMNKESAGAWFQSRRLQLPREGIKHQRGIRILQHRDVFKDDDAGGMEMRALPGTVRGKFDGLIGFNHWRKPGEFVSDVLTDAMANGRWSLLGLVPGRPLFTELGKKLPSAQKFVDSKQQMDAERNEWHVRAAGVIDKWTSAHRKMPAEIQKMHDLMFRVTISGVDPTRPDEWEAKNPDIAKAREEVEKKGDRASAKAKRRVAEADNRAKSYDIMRAEFAALPQEAQDIFKSALQELVDLDKAGLDALEKSIKDNAGLALKRAEREYRKDMARIRDQGLEGDDLAEAEDKARTRLEKARARFSAGEMGETLQSLRKQFESARLQGPYFPLFRSGKYFVAARDTDGVMVSFQMMDSVQKQRAAAAQLAEAFPAAKVTSGLSADRDSLREVVDPRFVADVESLLADSGASEGLMDAVWQRYLQTMPEQSLRTSALHRKAVPGYNQDALRAFAHHMFHGAHQTMRLKYAAELETSIIDAMDQAALADDRNRAEAVVQEMARRKDWVLAPQNAPWVSWASGLTFLWYLGVSPAAALVNISQTTIMGPAIIKAKFRGVTVSRALRELTRASNDFARGQGVSWKDTWSAENAPGLTEDERAAIREGYRQGTIDKTQSHDTTSVAESGVEYNSAREKIMRAIGFFYHHAERFNREVTFLAAYRLARDEGLDFTAATEKAKAVTWDTHFSYVNSDRPRFMQGDIEKVIFTFRQFSVNLIWRLWRDTHQSFNGSTPEERAEARTQVIGITLSMFAHAGIKGVWGYGMLMALMALFLPGDREDHEEWLEKALIKEGDDIGTAAWNFAMGSVLNGVPGQLTGIALSERIGSPDLWFRTPDSDLEGQDLAMHYLRGLAGPTFGIGEGLFRAASFAGQGELVRGVEAATPKFLRDLIRTGRFATEGVTTIKGDDILESMSPWELAMQANGFTPARLDAAYQDRGYLYLVQDRIESERRKIHRAATDALSDGKPIPPEVLEQVNDFNRRYPFFAINGESIRRSYRARIQSAERTVGGANLNPKLDAYLRELLAPGYR